MRPKRVMREWGGRGVGRKESEGKEKREAGRRGDSERQWEPGPVLELTD